MSEKKSPEKSRQSGISQFASASVSISPEGSDQQQFPISILECTPVAFTVVFGNRFLYSNPAFESLTGYSKRELFSMSPEDVLTDVFSELGAEEPASPAPKLLPKAFFDSRIVTKQGCHRWVAAAATPFDHFHKGSILLSLLDITERKEREDALSRSEYKYKRVFELAPDMIIIYELNGTVIDVNDAGAKMWGVSREKAIGIHVPTVFWTEEDRAKFPEILEETLRKGEYSVDIHGVHPDGQLWYAESNAKVAELWGETFIIVIVRDVTERRRLETQLRSALREKETLLREIHHRVKNNMQIISTLLNLQLRNAEDLKTKGMFRESQNRILSMAMIHEKLYQSEGLYRVDLREYIGDLAREVFTSFGEISEGVSLRTEVGEITLDLDTAIPCGLIIIELISNALKYAFPKGQEKGEIQIGLRHQGSGRFLLTVSDNGVGIPEDIHIYELKSLGLRLVSDLARYQLKGEMKIAGENGTSVYVKFKEKEECTR